MIREPEEWQKHKGRIPDGDKDLLGYLVTGPVRRPLLAVVHEPEEDGVGHVSLSVVGKKGRRAPCLDEITWIRDHLFEPWATVVQVIGNAAERAPQDNPASRVVHLYSQPGGDDG